MTDPLPDPSPFHAPAPGRGSISQSIHGQAAWGPISAAEKGVLLDWFRGLDQRVSGVTQVLSPRLQVTLKAGPLGPSAAKRHRWRGLILNAPTPARAEFDHLRWLAARLFQVPEPVAALEVRRGLGWGRARIPVAQLLATRTVPDARPFDEVWREAPRLRRIALCSELGGELGRMHALRFLHADLYPRNVLVAPVAKRTGERALWWIDAWAGGPTAWLRGSFRRLESDLGTWLAGFEPGLEEPYLGLFLTAYLDAREDNGRAIQKPASWFERVTAARRRELRRWERQRYRLRGERFPIAGMVAAAIPPRRGSASGL